MISCQQYELYGAEGGILMGRRFETEAALQAWVDALRDEPWWSRFYPQVQRVEVRFVKGPGSCGGWFPEKNAGRIEMEPEHRNELIVLHELSHVLAAARYRSQAHCPWFARVYLELVYLVMGGKVWRELHASFDKHGVKHDPPREDFEIGRVREL